jgi:hypothetical protein
MAFAVSYEGGQDCAEAFSPVAASSDQSVAATLSPVPPFQQDRRKKQRQYGGSQIWG